MLVFALLGVGDGALISGLGIGIVLSYRGSGLINISVGAFAMMAGYSFWALHTGYFGPRFGTAAALLMTYAVAIALAAIFECLVVIPLRNAAPLAKLVASPRLPHLVHGGSHDRLRGGADYQPRRCSPTVSSTCSRFRSSSTASSSRRS